MKDLSNLIRPCIYMLEDFPPCSSEERGGFLNLDANESPFNTPENRYPDNNLDSVKSLWGKPEGIPAACIHLCNGTEEAVDQLIRICCTPQKDNVLVSVPTRIMFARRAAVNDVECRMIALSADTYDIDAESVLSAIDEHTKIIYFCRPNSPVGNLLSGKTIETIADLFDGLVVVDESYIDYVPQASLVHLINRASNLVIVRSFSHAWAAAGMRMAVVVARPSLIRFLELISFRHSIGKFSSDYLSQLMRTRLDIDKWTRQIIEEREKVYIALKQLSCCTQVFPSNTNFILVRFKNAAEVSRFLTEHGINVCSCVDRPLLDNCLRITIGLAAENSCLLGALRKYQESVGALSR